MAIEAGNVLEGIVTGITAFGAFVELNKLRRVAKKTLNRNAKSFDPSPSFVSGNSIHNAAPEDRPPLKIG